MRTFRSMLRFMQYMEKNTIKKVEIIHSGTAAVFGAMGAGYKHQTFRRSYDCWNYNFLYEYNEPDSFESK